MIRSHQENKNQISPKLHWDILDEERKKLLPKLAFLKEQGFYLAGGTGLSLQIGHRRYLPYKNNYEKNIA